MVTPLRRLVPGGLSLRTGQASSSGGAANASAAATPAADATAEDADSLDVCLLSYRSDPYSGGQGVYVKYLSRALTAQGHDVDVISGRPYPDLDPDVDLVKLPGTNVVDETDRLRAFEPGFLADWTELFEWLSVLTGGFPEPYTFGERVVRHFRDHDPQYDVVHDNQSLCYGLLDLVDMGVPTVATIHHPITVDRDVALRAADGLGERLLTRRWFRFLGMQAEVAGRLPHVIAVSEASKETAVDDFGVASDGVAVVHNGIDAEGFRPLPDVERREGRIMTTVSADAPLKGTRYLLRAFAAVRDHPSDPELVVVGEFNEGGECERLVDDLGIADSVTTCSEITTERMVELYATAALAVVPSLYEGFGLPAGEAMACGVPVVASTGGGLPEVVGDAGLTVPPGDVEALAGAVRRLLDDAALRERLGENGRDRVRTEFDWAAAARETVAVYREAIADADD
ncbi:MAG: glycosyltransferase family 4 protein [Haloarculaceae archaeon]